MNALSKGMKIYKEKTKETLEFESLNEGDKYDIRDYLGLNEEECTQFYLKSGYGRLQGMYCDGAEYHLKYSVEEIMSNISRLGYTENKYNKRKIHTINDHLKTLISLSNQIMTKHHNLICMAKLEILKKHKETIDIIKEKEE